MRLRWTTPATNDLYNIIKHIQQDNPDAASKVAETLYDGCSSLEKFLTLVAKDGSLEAENSSFPACLTSLCIAFMTK
jgi:plasmid stabilization system protein ParE